MPTYDYRCRDCGHTIELIHGMTEDGPSACEVCGGPVRRVLFPTGIIFKGSGFYRNDSRAGAASGKPSPSADGPTATKTGSTDGSAPSSSTAATGAEGPSSPPTTSSTGADG